MARKSSIPEEILRYVPCKCCRVRNDNGVYRVYKYNAAKLLIAYDIRNQVPLAYRTYRGSGVDKCSVVEFLESRSFSNTKFIVDRGFYSEKVLNLMSEKGI